MKSQQNIQPTAGKYMYEGCVHPVCSLYVMLQKKAVWLIPQSSRPACLNKENWKLLRLAAAGTTVARPCAISEDSLKRYKYRSVLTQPRRSNTCQYACNVRLCVTTWILLFCVWLARMLACGWYVCEFCWQRLIPLKTSVTSHDTQVQTITKSCFMGHL